MRDFTFGDITDEDSAMQALRRAQSRLQAAFREEAYDHETVLDVLQTLARVRNFLAERDSYAGIERAGPHPEAES